ncbi:MAG: M20 metallopeptidase family protein [Lachnospiraceae bacterium]
MDIKNLFDMYEEEIIEFRRWFHRNPEVSLKEKKTSAKIKKELKKMDLNCEDLPPNYGVSATIKGGKEGKTLVIRADIDALPVIEKTGLSFASENEGVMHACGHDAHIAMLLGAAKVLQEKRSDLNGTVKIVFQAAEEIGLGYEEVLESLSAAGKVDGVIGLHVWSAIPEGQILLYPGAVFAGGLGYHVEVVGKGGHGARPDLTNDPIKAICDLVLKFASIPSNYYDVLDHSVVNVGKIEAGTLGNIFPSKASIYGGIRWYKPGGGQTILEIMNRIADGVGIANHVNCNITVDGGVPPVMNNPDMIEKAKCLLADIDGLRNADQTDPICAGDNIGYILEAYPGIYGILGTGKPGVDVYPQHHSKFDIDEKALRKGSEFMVRYALDFLK